MDRPDELIDAVLYLLYHLEANTALTTVEEKAKMFGDALKKRYPRPGPRPGLERKLKEGS